MSIEKITRYNFDCGDVANLEEGGAVVSPDGKYVKYSEALAAMQELREKVGDLLDRYFYFKNGQCTDYTQPCIFAEKMVELLPNEFRYWLHEEG